MKAFFIWVQVPSSAPKMAMSIWHKPFFCTLHSIRDLNGWESHTLGQIVVCLRQMMDTHQLPPRRDSEAEQAPSSAPKNTAEKDTFSAVFFYPSRRLGISSPHEAWWISSALWAVYHHASACIFLRLDETQHLVLMIYRNKLRMIYKACALILLLECGILHSKR